jgi:hypothetical protein
VKIQLIMILLMALLAIFMIVTQTGKQSPSGRLATIYFRKAQFRRSRQRFVIQFVSGMSRKSDRDGSVQSDAKHFQVSEICILVYLYVVGTYIVHVTSPMCTFADLRMFKFGR